MIRPVLRCPHCTLSVPPPPPGSAPEEIRRAAIEGATEMAAHLRGDHGDEEGAIRLERWAVHVPPIG